MQRASVMFFSNWNVLQTVFDPYIYKPNLKPNTFSPQKLYRDGKKKNFRIESPIWLIYRLILYIKLVMHENPQFFRWKNSVIYYASTPQKSLFNAAIRKSYIF